MRWKNVLVAFAAAVFFSLLAVLGVFTRAEDQVYDFFLRFRVDRQRINDVVFLDVDDDAIAHNGVFPWPRSVTADGLLRLKEYGARAAVFDIEFIDKGPQGVDTIYLNQGLPADFDRSFSDINSAAADVFSALKSGRLDRTDIDDYAQALSDIISGERERLYGRAQGVARDNDQYLIQSSALFGKSWVTVNLRSDPLSGEQAERRPLAEERFSYPVTASADTFKGKFVDILPPLPGFAQVAKGAGFTNVEVDEDGIRRRISLAQEIDDHWYLQLAFAPLVDYLGKPEIQMDNRKLVMKGAELPGGIKKDITIPLDGKAMMMLDWPPEKYLDSFHHVSFADFSLLEDIEAELEQYARAFDAVDISFFAQFDPSLVRIPIITADLANLFDTVHTEKNAALENCSEESFTAYLDHLGQSRALIQELLNLEPGTKTSALVPDLIETYPESADAIRDEAEYITALADYLKIDLDKYEALRGQIESAVRDKFCILGRVDTGTTDIGANPFWGEYVNVGTHGVILDMILSNSFITPLDLRWRLLFALILVPLFFLVSAKFAPVSRVMSGFIITVLIAAASIALFRYTGIFFGPLVTVLAMISAVIIREIIAYAGSEKEKQFIRKAFSTYVSDDVVKEIIANPSRLQLGGTKRHMSAIFTDIQGFSSISEKLDPEKLVSLLNRYLTAMSDVVLGEKGTIDKYEGDAIIAFFGAPVDLPDHAYRACVSAIHMKRIERELNKVITEEKLAPAPLLTRIGINTGSMVAGNMGTENKMDYTIMGNAVNLTARLEGVNKVYGTWILASGDTIRETGGRILSRRLDQVRVLGINEPVRLYELVNTIEDAKPEERKLVEVFHQALEYYEKQQWKNAAEGFRETLSMEHGGPSAKYLRRCEIFIDDPPPPESWDGIVNLTEK